MCTDMYARTRRMRAHVCVYLHIDKCLVEWLPFILLVLD